MAARDYIDIARQYAADIIAGRIPAGKYTRLACVRYEGDLKRAGSAEFPYILDERAARRACKFKELLPHVKGVWAKKRQRIVLSPHQIFITVNIFGWVHIQTGLRRFNEAYIEVPRKNAKSTDAAMTGLYLFAADGEPGAEVFCGATTEKQAWMVFEPARFMALRTPALCDQFGITVHAKALTRDDGSKFEPIIGEPGDGDSPHGGIVDEFHEHTTPVLYNAFISGMGAREQPLLLAITTAGEALAGPCWDRHNYVQAVLDGTLIDERVFGIIFSADPQDDWTTIETAIKANPNFNVSVFADYFERRLQTARQSPYLQNNYKTKHLNIWVGTRAAWLPMSAWLACPKTEALSTLKGRKCYGGIDLGAVDDPSAVVLLFPPAAGTQIWRIFIRIYVPEAAVKASEHAADYAAWQKLGALIITPGEIADYDRIKADVLDLTRAHDVAEIGFDIYQATHLAGALLAKQVNMVRVPQNPQHLSEPMREIERLIRVGKLAHEHNPMFAWMVGNTIARESTHGNIYPSKPNSHSKIDGVLAMLNAASRAFAVKKTGGVTGWLKS